MSWFSRAAKAAWPGLRTTASYLYDGAKSVFARAANQNIVTLATLALTIVMTVVLSAWAYWPDRLVEATLQPQLLDSVKMMPPQPGSHRTKHGTVIDIVGVIDNPSVTGLHLRIYEPEDSKWYLQPCCAVSGGVFYGTAQLGSAAWPVTENGSYPFELVAVPSGATIALGVISVHVGVIVGSTQWAIVVISFVSLLASLLQIWQITCLRQRRRQPTQEPSILQSVQ